MKTPTLLLPFLVAALSLAPSVQAHGLVYIFGVDGTDYKGNLPNGGTDTPSPIRQVTSQDPIYGASSLTLNCGTGSTNADLVVDAMPGSKLSWLWKSASLGNWPHDTGPMLTYLASCGDTTCDKFDSRTAKWFKIDQAGQDGNGGWAQKLIMNGTPFNATLPDNLAPGEYLVRHEIIALHLAMTQGKAEFYPSCQQIKVNGDGNGVPSPDQLLSFPGAYSDDDPGLFTPDVYNPGFQYTFPGGPIATLVTSDGGNNNGTSMSVSSSSTPKPTSTTSVMSPPVPSGTGSPDDTGSSSCMLKRNKNLVKRSKFLRSDPTRPHRVSRVMGRLLHGDTW
jgi:hypothetical protein